MSKYNRYCFIKKNYPSYVVFIKNKGNLETFDSDLKIVNLRGFSNFFNLKINYIITDCLVLNIYQEETNNYFYYFKIILLIEIVNFIRKKMS